MATRWRPGNCACIVEYDGVDDNDVIVGLRWIRMCGLHGPIVDAGERITMMRKHNRQTGIVTSKVQELYPDRAFDWAIRDDGATRVITQGWTDAERETLRGQLRDTKDIDGQAVAFEVL